MESRFRPARELLIMVNRMLRIMETKGFTRAEAHACLAATTALVQASERLRTNEDSRPTWTPDSDTEI